MPQIVDPEIERYAEEHTTPPPPYLAEVAEETRRTFEYSQMMVGTLEGRFLEMLAFISGARRVLEIGTFSGYSSLSMAAGLPPGSSIVTCELDPGHAEMAKRHIAASPYADRIEVMVGPAIETIRTLEGPFDLIFIDADKPSYSDYYEAALSLVSPRGLIVVDNTLWSGAVLDRGDTSAGTIAIKALNDRVVVDPRVVCVQLTVRDGVTLIRKA